jgi:DNA-binding winged helix-turn-helix (wHTH) protein/Tol biopolymer transport system component
VFLNSLENGSSLSQFRSRDLKEIVKVMEPKGFLDFGSFRVDLTKRLLLRSGQPVSLPSKAFEVLLALTQRPGEIVSKDQLMQEVWPDTFVEEGNLTQTIFILRKALGDSDGQSLIITVPRHGYRFAGTVSTTPASAEQPSAGVSSPVRRGILAKAIAGRLWWISGIVLLGVVGTWILTRPNIRESQAEPRRVTRFTISSPENTFFREGRVSPDGRWLAFIGVENSGKKQLWVRRLDALAARPLGPVDYIPFWSPDSRFIAFGRDGKLMKIEASGGAPQTICSAGLMIGGSWGSGDTIIFGGAGKGGEPGLFQVPASGGEPKLLTQLDSKRGERQHSFPVFLPDGRHSIFTIQGAKPENRGIYVNSLDSPQTRIRLVPDVSNAEYAPASAGNTNSGYLLFARGDILMAQRFSATNRQLGGEAFSLSDRIVPRASIPGGSFSASRDGILLISSPMFGSQLTWFDRVGQRLGTIGNPAVYLYPQLSPDGQTLAVDVTDSMTFLPYVWLFPKQGTPARFTFRASLRPLWSPDGGRIVFESLNTGIYVKPSGGKEDETLLLESANLPDDAGRIPCEWSPDSRFLLYSQIDSRTGYDLWKLPLSGARKPVALLNSEFNESCGTLSPDGHWIAYASDESGRSEIYVRALPEEGALTGRQWQISYNGGSWPKWRRDGKELFYLDSERKLIAVDVKIGMNFEAGTSRSLFATRIHTPDARFDVTSDGRRFIVPSETSGDVSLPPTVILNWISAVKI